MAASRITSATRQSGNSSIHGPIKEFDFEKIDREILNLKEADQELGVRIAEYNEWAEKAGKRKITFSKY